MNRSSSIFLWLLWIVPSAIGVVAIASKIRFSQPNVLWLLWLLPALGALYWVAAQQRKKALDRFADPKLLDKLVPPPSPGRSAMRGALIGLALTGILLAAAGPQWGFQWEEVTRRGVDVVVALDLSRSMLAEDAKPNRLAAAKREIRDLIELLQGDRVGLVVFAGTAFTQCPLTLDYGAFEVFLDQLNPEWVPVGGTDLAGAVRQGVETFAGGDTSGKALIIITDGEDHEGTLPEAAEEARKAGVHVFVVGMGAPEGAPIPDGRGGFVQFEGKTVLTKLDEPALKELALTTEGSYVRSVAGDIDLRKIYLEDIKTSLEARELSSSRQRRWEERYQWLLFPALLLLLVEALMGPPRRRSAPGLRSAALLLFLLPATAHAGFFSTDPARAGHSAFADGQFQEALDQWVKAQVADPADRRLDYNIAQAHYRLGNYPDAEKAFGAAAVDRQNSLAPDALYGLGNAAFQQGRYPEAIAAYDDALQLRPDDEDAQANRDLAQKKWEEALEESEKEPQEPPPEQDQQDQQDQDQQEQQEEQQQQQEQQQGSSANEENEQQDPSKDEQDKEQDGEQEDDNKGEAEEEQKKEGGKAEAADIDRSGEPDGEPTPTDPEGAITNQTREEEGEQRREPVEGALPPEQAEALLNALKADQAQRNRDRTKREAGKRGRVAKDW
jgi:Ca-activated chloride channel homolog